MYLSRNGVITGFFFGGGGAAAGDQQAIVMSLTALDYMQLDQGQTGAAGAEAVQLARDSGERIRLIRAAGRLNTVTGDGTASGREAGSGPLG